MKTNRFAALLVALNLILVIAVFRANSAPATGNEAPVLRGRALELVDDKGRVRCEIKLHPADPNVKMPSGTKGYPETMLLRLIDSKGGPNVKIAATDDGAAVSLANPSGYIQMISRGTNLPFIKIVAKDGREKLIDPQK